MKKIYITLLLLCQFSISYAQEKHEVIKKCLFEYAHLYTKNYGGNKEKKAYEDKLKSFFEGGIEHKEIKQIIDKLEENQFKVLSNKLKQTKNIISTLKDNDEIIERFFKEISDRGLVIKGKENEINDLKNKLLSYSNEQISSEKEVVKEVKTQQNIEINSTNTEIKKQRDETTKRERKTKRQNGDWSHILEFVFGVFLILFCLTISGLVWGLYQKNKQLKRRIEELKKEFEKKNNQQEQFTHQKNIEQYELKIKKLSEENDKLAIDFHDLKNKYVNPIITKEWNTKFQKDLIFYAGIPTSDGIFTKVLETKDDDIGFYELIINGSNAEFQFNSEEKYMQGTIYATDIIIQPVCEEENQCKSSTKMIKTMKKGKAVKQGEQWKITEKALIRYE